MQRAPEKGPSTEQDPELGSSLGTTPCLMVFTLVSPSTEYFYSSYFPSFRFLSLLQLKWEKRSVLIDYFAPSSKSR